MRKIGYIILALLSISLTGCRKETKPQEPANQPETDTIAQNLLYTNQMLVEQSNKELALFVKQSGTQFALHDYGFWYRWLERTENVKLKTDDQVTIHYQVWLMDSTLCADIVKEVRVGKKEVPNAIDHALTMMRMGEIMEIIAPWYCAYGQKGEDRVLPYTNVRFRLETLEQ